MKKVTVDTVRRAKFAGFTERIEICDETQCTLGYFTPLGVTVRPEDLDYELTEEDIAQCPRSTKRLTSDDVLETLRSLRERIEVCDESGRALGHYMPLGVRSAYELLYCPLTDEEVDRRRREGGGRMLAEILATLERMA